jgi:hypothetical protein
VQPLDDYFAAWNKPQTERRGALLERSVTTDVELIHPTWGRSHGIDALLTHIGDCRSAFARPPLSSRAAWIVTMTSRAIAGTWSIGIVVE